MSDEAPKQSLACETKQKEIDLQRYRKEREMLRKGSHGWAEIKVLSYLMSFGNTREDDLVAFVACTLNKPASYVRKALDRMVKDDKIKRVVHDKLEPHGVYFAEGSIGSIDYSLWLLAGIDLDDNIEKYRKAIMN